jgi:hypothetical protein
MWRSTDYIYFLLGERDADIIDINYKKKWDVLFYNQIFSSDYFTISFLVRSAAPFAEIMPRATPFFFILFGSKIKNLPLFSSYLFIWDCEKLN